MVQKYTLEGIIKKRVSKNVFLKIGFLVSAECRSSVEHVIYEPDNKFIPFLFLKMDSVIFRGVLVLQGCSSPFSWVFYIRTFPRFALRGFCFGINSYANPLMSLWKELTSTVLRCGVAYIMVVI